MNLSHKIALMLALVGATNPAMASPGSDALVIVLRAQITANAAATQSQVTAAIAAAPFVKTVQAIAPDVNGNVNGLATATALSNVVIAGDQIQVVAPATGTTVTPATGTTVILVNNTALLLALTVALPINPVDGQRFTVSSAAGVTTLAFTGGTMKGGLSTLSVAGYARFIYSASAGYWFRYG